jgi:hypothetical protein
MLRLASIAACAASSLLIMGASFALGYSCACAPREPKSQSPESTPGARRAAPKARRASPKAAS